MMSTGCKQGDDTPDKPEGDDGGETDVQAPADTPAELPVIPVGLDKVDIPEDNPMTADKVALGKLLYFDTRLSKDNTISCATCHDPQKGWAERTATSTGICM